MGYTPQTWANGAGGGTQLSAARLTYAEAGIAAANTGLEVPTTASSYSALQSAATAAATNGTRLVAAGTVTTSSTLTITSSCDLSNLTYNYTGGGIAIQVGDPAGQLFRADVKLPRVVNTSKTVTGWAQSNVAGTTGVRVTNAYSCAITIPYVSSFATGVLVEGRPIPAIQGTQQCNFYPMHLDNNKVNLAVTPVQGTGTSDSGWSNQNSVFGGRMTHNSGEGSQVSGTRHVVFSNSFNIVNGWVFYGTSLESPDVVEYHVECYGQYNTLDSCRFENTGGDTHRRVWSRGSAKHNRIRGGFNAGQISQVKESTAHPFLMDNEVQRVQFGGNATVPSLLVENEFSSTSPAFTIMGAGGTLAGDDPSTAYAVQASSQVWKGKRPADSFDRLQMDYLNGRVYVGDASAAPAGFIGGTASAMFVGGSVPFCPLTTATQDLGTSSLQWRDIRLSRGLGAFGTTPPTTKPSVTGSRGGNAALASLLTALASYGLITDSSTA